MTSEQLTHIIEAALMVAGRPLTPAQLQKLVTEEGSTISLNDIKAILESLQNEYQSKGIQLRETASGFQFQAKVELSSWLQKLWEERPPRYSRAFLETLSLIAYRQPITRAEIEEIRGVAVNTTILKTLLEREWVKIMGYREVPGKPALYGTTKQFLDHFNLKNLEELPTLAELKDLDSQEAKLQVQLELDSPETREDIEKIEEIEEIEKIEIENIEGSVITGNPEL